MCDQPTGQTSAGDDGAGGDSCGPIPCVEQNRNCCKTDPCTGDQVMPPGPPCPPPAFDPSALQFAKITTADCPIREYDPCSNPCSRIPGQHPFCPPGQVIGILPRGYVRGPEFPRPVQKPYAGPPPHLPWYQCRENYAINDQVRRPMARWCHIRELPPIVVPCSEIQRIQERITRSNEASKECEELKAQKERERRASYKRHSEWNYTVESLLARKRQEEEDKEKQLVKDYCEVTKQIKDNRDRYSAEKIARARQQLLYRKGLIKDFHAAMAYSKVLKETEDLRKAGASKERCQRIADRGKRPLIIVDPREREREKVREEKEKENWDQDNQEQADGDKDSKKSSIFDDPCMLRLINENNRPDYAKFARPKKPCNPKLLEILKCDEERVAQRQAEMEKEKCQLKEMRTREPLPWPPAYSKYIEEPKCSEDADDKYKEQDKMRQGIFLEIHDKLATSAFIESHEKEIERQACEYNQYKRNVERLRKEKEKQLIEDKVAYNMKMQEKAAAALVELKAQQQSRANNYDCLKAQWEAEYEEKVKNGGKGRQELLQKVATDFICRKDVGGCRRADLDATREWEKQRCYAVQDYEKQCEQDNTRKEKAKELAKYHLEQVAEKVQREEAERGINAAWGEKSKCNYACEMKEMKDYAYAQIQEWQAKGRPTFPMKHAMKKWDYDAGMTPFLYSQTSCAPICRAVANQDALLAKNANCPPYESTAERLGFCTGQT